MTGQERRLQGQEMTNAQKSGSPATLLVYRFFLMKGLIGCSACREV